MFTLGISCYYHDSAAALLENGHVIAAVEEERFSRKKFDDDFPKMAIQWCLKEANISAEQIDSVAFYDKPVLKFERLLDNYIAVAPRGLYSFLDTIPKWLHKRLWIKNDIRWPHSLGLFYSAFTYFLGFKVNEGEYKLMGLSSYGKPKYYDLIMENLIDVKDDGSIHLNM